MIPSIYPTDELFKALDNHLDGFIIQLLDDGLLSHVDWHRSDKTFMRTNRELYKKFSKNPAVSSELIVAFGVLGGLKIKTLISRHGEELVKTVIGHPLDPIKTESNRQIENKIREENNRFWAENKKMIAENDEILSKICELRLEKLSTKSETPSIDEELHRLEEIMNEKRKAIFEHHLDELKKIKRYTC